MLAKKVKLRILYLAIFLITISIIIFFILKSLEDNVVYFFSPTDIYNKPIISINEKIRVGGLVKEGSVRKKGKNIIFVITDLKNEVIVSFVGLVPNLFAESKGVVAEGKLRDKKYFIADKILAKHDENYMPPEVNEALNKTN
jgi:cytochrome c-type biogenesis protein CcmE